MFDYLKNILLGENKSPDKTSGENSSENLKLQIATCALFIEMANADSDFTEEERNKIISVMQNIFSTDKEAVEELIELSENRIKKSISLYEFTSIVNEHFSNDEKFELLKNLWRLIYIDEKLDMYEDQLIKRIGGMLKIDHQVIIGAKLLVKEELKSGRD
ncbi:MAG: TerB family tellurite resistance protein [Ignavibacteriales bacterium]|nr:MAG: TerB family tellurite resistance protein [Ignavibacteriales bacterium]